MATDLLRNLEPEQQEPGLSKPKPSVAILRVLIRCFQKQAPTFSEEKSRPSLRSQRSLVWMDRHRHVGFRKTQQNPKADGGRFSGPVCQPAALELDVSVGLSTSWQALASGGGYRFAIPSM